MAATTAKTKTRTKSQQTVEKELVQYEIDWDKIAKNVREALEEHERQQLVEAAPYHPGYEGAVIVGGGGAATTDKVMKKSKTTTKKKSTKPAAKDRA